jgi:uncharacterized protein
MTAHIEGGLAPGEGWAAEMKAGEILTVTGRTAASLVCFNAANPRERFDQARTRVYNMKIRVAAGDALYSKLNNPLMVIVEDGFEGTGHHDLQYPGCREALATALSPWGVATRDVPQPLNLFYHVETDTRTGEMTPSPTRPATPVAVRFRAETDLIVAVAACPDPLASGGAEPVDVAIGGA